ncbi:MAG: mechanosensitive ion channel [Candidatus Eisenbacteria bacterium]|nr:mechanosensitive ion channel [Candidatus Eisenbacteria bacterium]
MEEFIRKAVDMITTWGVDILGAIGILILGRIAAGIIRGAVRKVMRKGNGDPGLVKFVGNIVYYLILVFAIVAALAEFGIQTTSFVAILGAAGFAIGFALQGSLSNFASGVMILVFRPFRVDDYISAAGVSGSVKEIGLFATTLATPDNVKILVPNSKVYGDTIQNYSAYDTRRVDWSIGIGYGSSIAKGKEIVLGVLKGDSRVLADPAPMTAVSELADSSVNLVARAWVNKADYWDVKFDLTRKIKEELDAGGVEIPFPQRTIHMIGGRS